MKITRITSALQSFLASHYPDCSADVFQMTVPPDKKMGDICLNIFGAVKQLKTSPHILGAALAEYLKQQDFVLDVQVL
jgi:arginyl-tRNA synthetase